MTPDPLHSISGPEITWTTVNFGEANPGVQTPLGLTFWLEASEQSLVAMGRALGAFSRREARVASIEDVDRRHMAGFHGRMAGNVNRFRELADRMPGTSGDAFEEQLLGVVRSGACSKPIRRRYPVVAVRLPVTARAASRELLVARAANETWWRASVADPGQASFGEAYRRFARMMYLHGLVTMLAQACFERVTALAERAGVSVAELSTGYGGLEETQLLCDLWAVARDGASLDAFVKKYGYHGPASGDLSTKSWREDRSALEQLLAAYADLSPDEHPLRRQARQTARRRELERQLPTAVTPLLRLTARFVRQREIGKTSYVQILDVARAAARQAGEDAYFLTTDEFIRGIGANIEDRRRSYEQCKLVRLPDTWRGTPEPLDVRVKSDEPIRGIGVVPGVVRGRIRVVDDPAQVELSEGEILVCETTNPSWVTLFLVAGAVVIDIGGALSHGAIAARELGVPCVINTRDGTRRLRTGDEVVVDGAAGTVEVLCAAHPEPEETYS